jgi:hypothetical protein
MAGALTISTLNNDTGVLATQNGMTGIAKAWVNFNPSGSPTISSSFNVSSLTRNGNGDYSINFTTAMPDANYSTVAINTVIAGSTWGFTGLNTQSTTATRINIVNTGGTGFDAAKCCVTCNGN